MQTKSKKPYDHILAKLPQQHAEVIAEIIEEAQDPYKTLFMQCCKRIRVLGIKGVLGTGKGRAMSLPVLGLWIDADLKGEISVGDRVIPTWYSVLFHEIGHGVDYITRPYRAAQVNDAIQKDVKTTLLRLAKDIDSSRAQQIADLTISGGDNGDKELTEEWMKQIKTSFKKETSAAKGKGTARQFGYYATSGISDIFGGVTGNRCMDTHSHPKIYWSWFMRLLGISPALEMFAETFSDGMLGFKARSQLQQTYLPSADKLLTDGSVKDPQGAIWKAYNKVTKGKN